MGYRKITNLYKNKDILLFKQALALEKIHGCLHSDTLIAGEGGYKKIKDINKGDKVFSYDKDIDDFVLLPVKEKIIQEPIDGWLKITLENGKTLKLTANHEVLTKNRGWVEAQSLSLEDDIVDM
jgi:intein/homing endonuclease